MNSFDVVLKQEGTTMNPETGDVWKTSAEEQELRRLRRETEANLRKAWWYTKASIVCILLALSITAINLWLMYKGIIPT